MAQGDILAADLDLAFAFSRSETGLYRGADGWGRLAAADEPRFDHAIGGAPRGLLVTAGDELGGGDRLILDELILPVDLLASDLPGGRDATVFHHFDPGSGAERRAWYSRNLAATINALIGQAGHHLALGVVRGFRVPVNSPGGLIVRYRGADWRLPAVLANGAAVVTDGLGRPLIACGAEQAD